MKKTALLLSVILVALLTASCFHNRETSVGDDDSGSVSTEIGEASDNVSDENSGEESNTSLADMSASELYDYAVEAMDTLHSYVTEADMEVVMEYDGEPLSFNIGLRQKTSGHGTDEALTSISFTDTSTGTNANFYYKNGVGYYSSNNERYSFDCSFEDLENYAYYIAFPDDEEEDEEDTSMEYILDNSTVTTEENGNMVICFSGVLTDEEVINDIFGYEADELVPDTDFNVDYTATVSSDGYLLSEVLKADFSAYVEETVVKTSTIITNSTSHINEKVDVAILESGYTHLGSIGVMYAADCYNYLMKQDDYSTVLKQNYEFNGLGVSDKISVERTFNTVRSDDNPRFSYNNIITVDAVRNQGYRYYGEGGTLYIHDGQSVTESELGELTDEDMLYFWQLIDAALIYGKDYSYTDNGDGTATLTSTYTDDTVVMFADYFAYLMYGEDYYGMFSYAEEVTVNFADVILTVDTESGVMISHQYNISADFVIDGKSVSFVEKSEIIASVDDVTVPEKDTFLGSSSL